jgi:hypothetical protein
MVHKGKQCPDFVRDCIILILYCQYRIFNDFTFLSQVFLKYKKSLIFSLDLCADISICGTNANNVPSFSPLLLAFDPKC